MRKLKCTLLLDESRVFCTSFAAAAIVCLPSNAIAAGTAASTATVSLEDDAPLAQVAWGTNASAVCGALSAISRRLMHVCVRTHPRAFHWLSYQS